MFVTPDSFSALVERLEKDYFIIMPTLGTKEPARLCTFRLRRYKSGSIVKKKGYRHCGYLLSHPDEYAEMLKNK